MDSFEDTIAALASPAGAGLRGIVRISGPQTASLLLDWLAPAAGVPLSRSAPQRYAADVWIPEARAPVAADIQWWPTTRSYTGQPLAEMHLPGSPPILQAVLSELYCRGVRPARPGEFTLRAFLAGKLDLLQAEGVLGVIDAADHRELQVALQQLAGGISHRLVELRSDLLELLSDIEAGLDFVEEHLEFVTREDIRRRLGAACEFVAQLAAQATTRMHADERPRVVLAGLPNAGKSTLFNALVGRDQALVSATPGTTRDFLTGLWDCHGLKTELIDTAGWEELATTIAASAHNVRADQLSRADLVLWCTACGDSTEQQEFDVQLRADVLRQYAVPMLVVRTKGDLEAHSPADAPAVFVSAHTALGINELARRVHRRLSAERSTEGRWLGSSVARCHEALRGAQLSLGEAEALAESAGQEELIAAELRLALQHLGAIVGAVYTDDLLDRIFSKFCIGK